MIPRLKLAHLPTPVELLPRLSSELGGPKIYVKRDDLTGIAFGGNKTRKLEYVVAEAIGNGAKTLITVGAGQSNHCRQTAAIAAKFGLDCILVLSGNPEQTSSGNLILDELLGAEIVWCRYEERNIVLQQTFQKAWEDGRRPYLIPLGASTPLGSLGYYQAFEEFIEQGQDVDWMVVASSSGGTQAGLVLGAKHAHWKGKVLGISIDHPANNLKSIVAGLAEGASELLGAKEVINPDDVLVNDDYVGAGYGIVGPGEIEAIQMFGQQEGLFLDPVYTGRAAWGMIDLFRSGYFKPADRILFWHTGGTPALFATKYRGSLINQQA